MLYIKIPTALTTATTYHFYIEMTMPNPSAFVSDSFEIATVNQMALSDYYIYDMNINFGAVPWAPISNNNTLYASLDLYTNPDTATVANAINNI